MSTAPVDIHNARVSRVVADETSLTLDLSDVQGNVMGTLTIGVSDRNKAAVIAEATARVGRYLREATPVRLVNGSDGLLNLIGPEGERLRLPSTLLR